MSGSNDRLTSAEEQSTIVNITIPSQDTRTTVETSLYLDQQYAYGGNTPIHEAAKDGDVLRLKNQLECGASVFCTTIDSITPLHYASLAGHPDCVRVLIEAGAPVNALDIDGASPLCEACVGGDLQCVKILLDAGAEVNLNLNFSTPLHEAVLRGYHEICSMLVNRGANLNANDLHFGTPLHVAAIKNDLRCAFILLKAGAQVNSMKRNVSPLHFAARHSSCEMVSLLLEFGANANVMNVHNSKPSNFATKSTLTHNMLIKKEKCPWNLDELCRFHIRSHLLNNSSLQLVSELQLPKRLKSYLLHEHPWCGISYCNGVICRNLSSNIFEA